MLTTIFFIATAYVGVLAGGWLRDQVWKDKANGPSRMLCGKKFYRVTLEP